ncbi:MAG: hypothetical protein KDD47_28755, partial [Acidobacteria bacterium]|nr:hypothetical protein [Acidobacteriota bacterium]
ITARDGGGRRTGVSEPEIWREGDQAVARRRIRTLPEVPSGCLDLLITSPGRQETFGSRLALSPADAAGGAPCPLPSLDGPITFHLERILGISHLVPDLFDSQPEVLAVLFIDDREAARSPETRHPPDPFAIDWRTDLGFDPHAQRLRLELWDMDPGSIPQTLATARWNPGELKVGRTTMTLERGLGIELDVLPEGGDPVVWRPEVLSLESIR